MAETNKAYIVVIPQTGRAVAIRTPYWKDARWLAKKYNTDFRRLDRIAAEPSTKMVMWMHRLFLKLKRKAREQR